MNAGLIRTPGRVVLLCVVALGWLAPRAVRADDPPDKEARIAELDKQMHDFYEQKKYRDAMRCAEELLKLDPDNNETMYNLACLCTLRGEETQAFEWLSRAIDHGFRNKAQLEKDSDLNALRDDSRWKDLMAHLERAAREKPQRAARPASPQRPARGDDDDDDDGPAPGATSVQAKVGELTRQVVAAAEKGDYRKGLALATEAHKLAPQAWITNYNMSCMHARLGHKGPALEFFEKAVDLGMRDVSQVENDDDLESIRDEPRFKKAFEKLKSNARMPANRHQAARPGRGDDDEADRPPPVDRRPENVRPRPVGAPAGKVEWNLTVPSDADRDRPMPLIVALHADGENVRVGTETWEDAADRVGAALLVVQGPVSSDGDHFEWGPEIDAVESQVMAALSEVDRQAKVNHARVCVVGFGTGGRAAMALATRHPDKFCGAVSVCARFSDREARGLTERPIGGLHLALLCGEDTSDYDAQKRLSKALKRAGAKVDLDGDGREESHKVKVQAKALKHALAGKPRPAEHDDDRPTRGDSGRRDRPHDDD